MPNKKKLYEALVQEGYDNFADEAAFNSYVDNADNRKLLFKALKDEGYDNFADEKSFDEYLGYSSQQEQADGITQEPVNPVKNEQAVDPEELKRYIIEHKGEVFNPKTVDMYGAHDNNKTEWDMFQEGRLYQLQAQRAASTIGKQLNERIKANDEALNEARKKQAQAAVDADKGYHTGRYETAGMASIAERQKKYDENFGKSPTRVELPGKMDDDVANLLAEQEYLSEAKKVFDAAKNDAGFFTGMKDALNASYLSFGATDLMNAERIKAVNQKLEAGEPLSESEQSLLTSLGLQQIVEQQYNDMLGRWYKAGKTTAEMAPFMAEMAINPSSSLGKMAMKASVKKFGEKGAKAIAMKILSRTIGDVAGATAMTATTGMPSVAADAINRQLGYVDTDIVGGGEFAGTGFKDGESESEAWRKAFTSRTIENWSEMVGEYFSPIGKTVGKGTAKLLDKMKLGKVNEFIDNINSSEWAKVLDDFTEQTQWNGPFGEFAEEQVGMVFDALLVGDTKWEHIVDLDKQLDVALGVGVFGTFMSLLRMGGYRTPKYRARMAVNKADKDAASVFGEDWEVLKDFIDTASDEELPIALANPSYSKEQAKAAFMYANAVKAQQAINTTKEKEKVDKPGDTSVETEAAYDEGTEISNPYDKHSAKIAADRAEAALGVDSENADEQQFAQMVVAGINNPVETINALAEQGFSTEQIEKAKNYYSAVNRMNGMTDALLDDVDAKVERANKEVDKNTNTDMGAVVQVVLRDGSIGYVVEGTVVPGEEGSIDVNNSDDTVFVRMQNGEVKMMNPNKDLSKFSWQEAPDALKDANNNLLRQKLIDQGIAEIDWNPGTPNPKVGDSFEMDGTPVTIVGLGKDGLYVAPTEEYQMATGNENKLQQLAVKAQQQGAVPVNVYKDWASAKLDEQEEAQKQQEEAETSGSGMPNNSINVQPGAETGVIGEGETPVEGVEPVEGAAQEPATMTLEDVVASLPKNKKGEIDYAAMTPQQQYQYTSLSESPEVALEDLQSDIVAAEEEIAKVQKQMEGAKGGKRVELRDKVKQLTAETDELKAFYDSVKPAEQEAVLEPEAEDVIDEAADLEEGATEPLKPASKPKRRTPKPKPVSEEEQPLNALKFAAQELGSGRMKLVRQSVADETGWGNEEPGKFIKLWAKPENGGVSVERAGELLMQLDREEGTNFFDQEDANAGRNTILELLGMAQTWGDIANFVKNNRAEQAKREEEAERAAYEAWIEATFHMSAEDYEAYVQMIAIDLTERGLTEEQYQEFMSTFVDETFNNVEDEQQGIIGEGEGSGEVLPGTQPLPARGDTGTPEGSEEADGGIVGEDGALPEGEPEGNEVEGNTGVEPVSKPYTIEPAQYTTKRGKVLDVFLVKFNDELSKEDKKQATAFAKELKGWWSREDGGYLMRSEEDAMTLGEHVSELQTKEPASLEDLEDVVDGNISFSEPQEPEQENGPVWQYIASVDKQTGFTTLRREDVSGIIPIGDARWTLTANSPQEMLDILRNPLNGMESVLEAVEVTLENRVKTLEMNRRQEEMRTQGVNGFKIGEKVLYKGKEATIHEFQLDGRPVLDDGMGPVIYTVAEWSDVKKIGSKPKEYHGGDKVFSTKHNANKDIFVAHHVGGKTEYTFTDGTKASEDEVQDPVVMDETPAEPINHSGNKLVTDERYAELRERMKMKLRGQMNMGIDPEILAIGTEMAVYHIEKGAKKFVEYAKAMIEDLGDAIRPYLKAFYNGARDLPEMESNGLAAEMTPYDEVAKINTATVGKAFADAVEVAETIVKEEESEKQAEVAKVRVKTAKKPSKKPGKKEKENVSLLGDLFNQNAEENESRTAEQPGNGGPEGNSGKNSQVGSEEREEGSEPSVRRETGSVPGNNVSDGIGSGRIHGVSSEQPVKRNSNNFSFGEGHIEVPSGEIAKLKANIAAIKTLKEIEASGKPATEAQKAVLAKYVGWGGLSAALDEQKFLNSKGWMADRNWNEKYLPYYKELRELLTEEEFNDAVQSTITSHYTPEEVIRGMWTLVERMGFKGGRINEPAAGIGHIIGMMPQAISERSVISGTELDSLSGRIAKTLYPDANIKVQGYEKEFAPKSKDLVITNVPFGKTAPFDKALDKALRKKMGSAYNLHNYFIAKGLLELKEGGIGVFVTSSATMDGANSKFREWVSANGFDLVGAIRLPNNAFTKNAGTSVTADMLVFRRRKPGERSNGVNFVSTTQIGEGKYKEGTEMRTKPIMVNEYFAEHPEMMLGEMMTAHDAGSGGLYSGASQTCVAKAGTNLGEELQNAIMRLGAIDADLSESQNEIAQESVGKATDLKNGTLVVEGDNVLVAINGELQPIESAQKKKEFTHNGKKQKVANAIRDYNTLKETLKSLIAAEQSENENPEPIRKKLNKEYDAFVAKYGTLNRNKALDDVIAEDFEHNLPLSLENVKRVPSATGKSMVWEVTKGKGILEKRVSFPVEEPKQAENLDDAIHISRSYRGYIDVPYISSLLDLSELDVITEMLQGGYAYRDPITGDLVDKDTYLSGNVREKLEQARAMAEEYPEEYQRNVEDLAAVQPETVRFGDISYRIGTPWIPTQYVNEFARDVLGVSSTDVEYIPELNEFVVSKRSRINDFAKSGQFRTDRVGVIDLLEYALNQRKPKIFDKKVTYGPSGKVEQRIPNEAETQAAAEKVMEISDKFIEYIDGRNDIHRELERIYNDKYNNYRLKTYNVPSFEHYPNSNNNLTLREHQKKAVQRCLSESTLLAHQVGTGKTFTMITTAMEMRRLGIAKKPMIVVQNATLEDFVKDFYKLYPGANVLAPGKDERSAENRKRLFNLIATGDFDAIVIPQSFMQFIPDDEGRKKELIRKRIEEYLNVLTSIDDPAISKRIEKEIDNLRDSLEGVEEKKGKTKKRVKDIANAESRITSKTEKVLGRKTDDVLTFEQMGIDALFIDEAHNFKKIGFASKMSNVKGVDTSASQRANSLLLKAQYVQEKNGGRNVILATGTPITNTMAEVWTMMKFVSPEILDTYNIQSFDDFATTFGTVEPSLEFTATGNFKIADRFKSYVNVPELVKAFRSHADVVLTTDVKEFKESNNIPKLKDGQMTNVVIEKNEDLEDVMDILIKKLEEYNEMTGSEKREWSALPLVVFSRAKQAAIDLRLLNPSYEDNPNSKTNHVVRNVLKLYKESSEEKGTQMIFCDSYQSPGEAPKMDLFDFDPDVPRFNLYEDIKKKLVEGGIPASEIAIVNNYDGERRKQLFEKVRNGDVRVLLGSTEKMGVGVNVQDRMFALHHIDAPIRPMDFEQRNGRILRQGNLYATWGKPVNVVTYGVQGTLDATAYDRLRVKQDFINQMMKGDVSGRVMEEQDEEDPSGMTFNQMAATLSGDKTAQLLFVAENELKKLRNLKRSDFNSKSGMGETIKSEERRLVTLNEKLNLWNKAKDIVAANFPEGVTEVKVNGETITEKFGPALDPVIESYEEAYSLNRGTAPLKLTLNGGKGEVVVHFDEGKMVYELYAGKEHIVESRQFNGGKGLMSSIEHQLKSSEKNYNDVKQKIAETKSKISGLQKAMNAPWGREEELKEKEQRVAELKKQLEEKAAENTKKKTEPAKAETRQEEKEEDELYRTDEEKSPTNVGSNAVQGQPSHLQGDAKVQQNIESATENEGNANIYKRSGEGALTADEVSMANDPVGKVLGISTRTAAERKTFAERERQRMIDRVNSLAKKLGLKNVEIVTDPSTLTDNQRKAKGFYSKSKRKITIVIPNHRSVFDAEQTLLHEAVAHYGLRELFGEQFEVFLNNVYRNAAPEVRERINQLAMKNGWNFTKATEEYLASLAEDTNFESMSESWWNKIKQLFLNMLHQIGFEGFTGVTLTDNELRYILWRSYENLVEPGSRRSIFGVAADIVKQDQLKVGNYSAQAETGVGRVAESSPYSRTADDVVSEIEDLVANHPDMYAVRTEEDIDALPTDRYTKRDIKERFRNPRMTGVNVGGGMMILFTDRMDEAEIRNTISHELAHYASRNLKFEDSYKMSALAYLRKHFHDSYEKVVDYPKEKWGEEAVAFLFEEMSKKLGFERILNGKFDSREDIGYLFYNITNYLNNERNRNNPLRPGKRSSSQRTNDGERTEVLQESGVLGNGERQVRGEAQSSVLGNERPGAGRELGSVSSAAMGAGYASRSEEVEDELYRGVDIEGMADNTARNLYEDSVKGKGYRLQEGFQDSMLSLKKLQDAIVKQKGGKLEEWEDAYTAENQMSSRDTAEIEIFTFNHFTPMMKEVAKFLEKAKLGYEDLRKYLFAKSGLERNRDFAVRDAINERAENGEDVSGIYEAYMQRKQELLKDLKDGIITFRQYCDEMDNEASMIAPDRMGKDYSGLTSLFSKDNFTDEAIAEVERVEGLADATDLWKAIKSATQFSLDRAKQSGVMNTDVHKKLSEMFEWYIPMRGWSETKARDVYEYFGEQEGVFNPTVKSAGGRKSLADDPLAVIANMAESAIFQGNRNQVKQKLLNLAFDKPTNLITVMDSWIENKGTDADPKWEYVYPPIEQDDDADVIAAKIKQFEEDMQLKKDAGMAKNRHGKAIIPYIATPKEIAQHIVRVKRNGREFVLILNGNPRAAQAINGLTNPETYTGIIERVSRKMNQFMAAAFTTKNPTFIMRNLSRDLIFSNTAVAIKESYSYGKKFRENQGKVIANMRGLMKRYQSGKLDMSNPLDKMFAEFIKNGGETGFAQLTSVDQYKSKIQRELNMAKGGGVATGKKVGRAVMDTIEFYNRCAEDVSRFTVYMTSRQMGRSIQRSVSDAKEITVNFNKRGSGSKAGGYIGFAAQSMRSLYLFFNAAVQALVNFKRLGKQHPVAFTTALSIYTAAGFVMPIVNEFLSSMLGGDDDDYQNLPEWVRRNNLVFSLGKWNGNAMFLTIPLPVEMRAFYGLGETTNQLMNGNVRGKDAAWQITGQFAEMLPLNFVTDAAGPWNAFTPDAFKPIAQAYITNKDWTGKPIYRDNGFNAELPEWTKAYAGTSKWLVNSAEMLNEFTGGDKYKTGWVDINPARLEHLFSGYLGGFGDMIMGTGKTISMIWDEDYRNVRNTPILKAFLNQSDERTSYAQVKKDYASYKDEYEETVRRLNGYKKELKTPETALEYAERMNFLQKSSQMKRYEVMRVFEHELNKMYQLMKENQDPEMQKAIMVTINQMKANAVEALRNVK